ncbi:MAG: CAP domain-containing protein [Nanoarchaeota archaeon]|nr:CAP domain-containing protein [Nanoarchaeota archaeon]
MVKLKHERNYYLRFFLFSVLFFFVLTYWVINQDTISKQVEVVTQGSSFFAKAATYEVLKLNQSEVGIDKQTYSIELVVFSQINKIRNDRGLDELIWDPMLAKLARDHSLDMAENDYLNHTNLIGDGPNERAKKLGLKTRIETQTKIYEGIGENIGFMPKGIVEDVGVLITNEDVGLAMVLEWMLSNPHRKNILTEDYRFTGVGVVYDGKGNYYLTQNFQ